MIRQFNIDGSDPGSTRLTPSREASSAFRKAIARLRAGHRQGVTAGEMEDRQASYRWPERRKSRKGGRSDRGPAAFVRCGKAIPRAVRAIQIGPTYRNGIAPTQKRKVPLHEISTDLTQSRFAPISLESAGSCPRGFFFLPAHDIWFFGIDRERNPWLCQVFAICPSLASCC